MKAGRKRAFDRDIALDKAMRLFWVNGYSATSIANLSAELGINTPSLYAAFGNKETLFKEVLAHYVEQYAGVNYHYLTETSDATLKQRLQACFYGLIHLFASSDTPRGCLLVKSVNESDSVSFPKDALLYMRQQGQETKQLLMTLLESDMHQASSTHNQDIETLVDYLLAVSYGLAVQAKAGQSEAALKSVFDHALSAIPNH
ncbi:TetR/AcrR family transcriptional regulator [Shewanella livingstonensis]|uniref:TetR/AcrR family transcriptional regulator n=1 Tax=Shewanella livingstonensis TaxID=150120 RepID=A0A3G8LR73_9GAMM|nr:TetR/AcrR family transcriptional regulator [Shewanella livingstonensis]AZG71725.1 TetR/AcrR family transcriptional regulator [Shewanella livingstonensis]